MESRELALKRYECVVVNLWSVRKDGCGGTHKRPICVYFKRDEIHVPNLCITGDSPNIRCNYLNLFVKRFAKKTQRLMLSVKVARKIQWELKQSENEYSLIRTLIPIATFERPILDLNGAFILDSRKLSFPNLEELTLVIDEEDPYFKGVVFGKMARDEDAAKFERSLSTSQNPFGHPNSPHLPQENHIANLQQALLMSIFQCDDYQRKYAKHRLISAKRQIVANAPSRLNVPSAEIVTSSLGVFYPEGNAIFEVGHEPS